MYGSGPIKRQAIDKKIVENDLKTRVLLSKIQEANKPFRQAYLQQQFPDYVLNNIPTIKEQLINNMNVSDQIATEEEIGRTKDQTMKHLLFLTSDDMIATQYILDNLSPENMASINSNYHNIYKDLKKNFPKGITKEGFIMYIKNKPELMNTIKEKAKLNEYRMQPLMDIPMWYEKPPPLDPIPEEPIPEEPIIEEPSETIKVKKDRKKEVETEAAKEIPKATNNNEIVDDIKFVKTKSNKKGEAIERILAANYLTNEEKMQ
jgi:hypothetical protein